MHACDHALFTRDNEALARIASQGDTFTSLYSRAVYMLRLGRSDEAIELLRHVIETAPLPIHARALVTLGSITYGRGDLGDAISLFSYAQRAAADPITALNVVRMNAVIRSAAGQHDSALADLGRAAELAGSIHPAHPVRLDFYNSVAVELIAIGHHEEAGPLVRLVTSSPVAGVYPEWMETAKDLAETPSGSVTHVPPFPTDPTAAEPGKLIEAAHRFNDRGTESEEVRFVLRRVKAATAIGETESDSVVSAALKLGHATEEQLRVCCDVLESTGSKLELARWAVRSRSAGADEMLAVARKIDSAMLSEPKRIGRSRRRD